MKYLSRDQVEAMTDRHLDIGDDIDDDEQERLDAIELDRAEARAEAMQAGEDW